MFVQREHEIRNKKKVGTDVQIGSSPEQKPNLHLYNTLKGRFPEALY